MKKVVVDTDCGVDDAVAIMIALAHSQLEVLGVTTVSGNVGVTQVTENVLRLLPVLGGEDIPVYRGASRPLIAQPHPASGVHGRNGLGDVELPDAGKRIENAGALDGLLGLARQNPGLTVVALGCGAEDSPHRRGDPRPRTGGEQGREAAPRHAPAPFCLHREGLRSQGGDVPRSRHHGLRGKSGRLPGESQG
jgi:hypothetical protein